MQAHATVIGNCILCISGDYGLLGIPFIFAKMGSIVTTLCSLAYWLLLLFIMFCPALLSSNLMNIIIGLCMGRPYLWAFGVTYILTISCTNLTIDQSI